MAVRALALGVTQMGNERKDTDWPGLAEALRRAEEEESLLKDPSRRGRSLLDRYPFTSTPELPGLTAALGRPTKAKPPQEDPTRRGRPLLDGYAVASVFGPSNLAEGLGRPVKAKSQKQEWHIDPSQIDLGRAELQPRAPVVGYLNLMGEEPPKSKDIKKIRFEEQGGICNGCQKAFSFDDFEEDHIVAKSRGGPDTDENIQLLCGPCNRIKGDRDMDYLWAELAEPRRLRF